ncbi:MAG: adenylosuccinate synthetase [Caudoviricetes sp.]|nr:MAG: adenylosuccinate synthetase [Caudoviricetes sp.]
MKSRTATLICDLQFGSTGKGLIAGYLAERDKPDTVITAWSANAGHTYIDRAGRKYVHCMLANGIVSPNLKQVLIGPGSQLDLCKLKREIEECKDILLDRGAVIYIHGSACVISERHIQEEAGPMTKIGSTKKGCGAALIEKIRRNPEGKAITIGQFAEKWENMWSETEANKNVRCEDWITPDIPCYIVDNAGWQQCLLEAEHIQIEGAQGYSLGLNSGFYPYVTSRECTPAQIVSDCAFPMQWVTKVVGTMRTYPIRVANRYDAEGNMVGYSGPGYDDQKETTFEELGQATELTTVTRLPRRIFTFSQEQTRQALMTVRPDEIFLNFVNYCDDQTLGFIINQIYGAAIDAGIPYSPLRYIGRGPAVQDVLSLVEDC